MLNDDLVSDKITNGRRSTIIHTTAPLSPFAPQGTVLICLQFIYLFVVSGNPCKKGTTPKITQNKVTIISRKIGVYIQYYKIIDQNNNKKH